MESTGTAKTSRAKEVNGANEAVWGYLQNGRHF